MPFQHGIQQRWILPELSGLSHSSQIWHNVMTLHKIFVRQSRLLFLTQLYERSWHLPLSHSLAFSALFFPCHCFVEKTPTQNGGIESIHRSTEVYKCVNFNSWNLLGASWCVENICPRLTCQSIYCYGKIQFWLVFWKKKKRQRGMNVNFWSDSDFAGSLYERGDDVQQIVYNCKRSSLNPIEGLKLLNWTCVLRWVKRRG